jgi:hypothetical protein
MNTPPQTEPHGQDAWLRHYEEVARRRSGIEHRQRSLSQRPIAVVMAALFLAGSIFLAALVL